MGEKRKYSIELLGQMEGGHGPLEIRNTQLGETVVFTYFDSNVSKSGKIDQDISNKINLPSSAFRKLINRIFLKYDLKLQTKIRVYRAICISTLVYESEIWILYRRHVGMLDK